MKKITFSETQKKGLVLSLLCLVALSTYATGGAAGGAAIDAAASTIRDYATPVGRLVQGIGAIVGVVGGVRIYNKWTNGDQDINKELIGYGGACVFLLMVPTFIAAFFPTI